jgi:hypothetical protein
MTGETKKSLKNLVKGQTPSLFSTFAVALLSNDWTAVEAKLANNINWHMMPNAQTRKGKKNVTKFLKASYYACQKETKTY